jgi:hypothetical protein
MNTQTMLTRKREQIKAANPARKRGLALEIEILLEDLARTDAQADMAQERLDRDAGWVGCASLINMED